MSALRRLLTMAAVVMFAIVPMTQAQVTTGSIAGTVSAADGSALPGVTVEAIHVPTGTRYDAVTGSNGRYTIPNVRVGGPYRVTATLEGFRPAVTENLQVGLGSTSEVPLTLQLAAVSEAITVTAAADEIINPNRTGAASEVSTEQIETLPTVNRSLQDFARTNPYFVVDAQDFSATRVNVAGRNNRYNSIQIDGAVNNDLFGLSDTGTPGGQTDAQPISIEAIQQLQLVVSPYDVRQGGFTGGGINAVTRSGTNEFSGSVFGSQRSPDLIGTWKTTNQESRPLAEFTHDQYGGRIGGPILRDRLFFFLSGEVSRRDSPTGFTVDGSSGLTVREPAASEARRVREVLMSRYNYDPGSLGDFSAATTSDLIFARLDWNVSNNHQLTLRHNYVDAARDVWGGRTETRYTFQTATYAQADETNSSVAQLNSVFGANAYNEARVSLQTIKDKRQVPVIFPSIEIGGSERSGRVTAGTERFSGANALDQEVFEFTDDFTLVRGSHTITVGTHNEFFEFKNTFLSEFYGYYFFPTLADFEAGKPSVYRISYATGDDPGRPTAFEAGQYGFYANDSWRLSNAFSFTVGIRADKPTFPDKPSFNQTIADRLGYRTDDTPSDDIIFSPRVGFNWQPGGSGTQQIRGGVGIFAGRAPYVWISNAYANTGIESVALSCSGTCQRPDFNPDPLTQRRDLGAGGALSVDLIDPDFEFPRVLRATLGYDRELPLGIRGSAELLWSQTQQDVFYYNVNRVQTGINALDGRPVFSRRNSTVADAIQLSNTSKGQETAFTLQLTRPFTNGLVLSANYGHQNADSAFDSTSSRAISNWQFRHTKGDIFAQDLSRSAFEMKHRFNISAAYDFTTGFLGHTVGLFYNVQSGRPYSVMMTTASIPGLLDPNGDGYNTNDLLYVPEAGQVIYQYLNGTTSDKDTGVTAEQAFGNYMAYLGVDPNSGQILDRYQFTEPWTRSLDLHYGLGVPISRFRTEVTADVTNLLNLFNEEWGVVKFVSNQNTSPVSYRGIDPATGKHIYRENYAGAFSTASQFTVADTRSRWTARVGVRVSF
ncbi:MAG TPA: carboxypeptidase regulatory-like domain-containing protein [Thermoanaerobaculia bacterium]